MIFVLGLVFQVFRQGVCLVAGIDTACRFEEEAGRVERVDQLALEWQRIALEFAREKLAREARPDESARTEAAHLARRSGLV